MKIILASNSPRRRELLAGLDLEFEVKVLPNISEAYPADTPTEKIAEFIAVEKAEAYLSTLNDDELVITADTIVIVDGEVLGKPTDETDAKRMLQLISGRSHQVITGVCLMTNSRQHHFSVTTDVAFKQLSADEIDYYVKTYKKTD